MKNHKIHRQYFLESQIKTARVQFLKYNTKNALNIYHLYLSEFLETAANFSVKLSAIYDYERSSFQYKNEDKILAAYLQMIKWMEKNISINHANYTTCQTLVGKLYIKKG